MDMYLRKSIISMALDIEHTLKTQLLYDLSQNEADDGYHIAKLYLTADYRRLKSLHDKVGTSAASDLIQKKLNDDDNYALWEIVEILSFGEFIDLYQLYYSTYHSNRNNFSSYLWSIKFLRNAAAHNNCLLNSLKAPYHVTIHKTKEIQFEISKIKTISQNAKDKWMTNPVIILAFFSVNAYNTIDEQKNFGFFRGDDACIVSVFFTPKKPSGSPKSSFFTKNMSF